MLDKLIVTALSGWTPGAVGIWTFGPVIIAIIAKGLWKELPALLDAWTRRSDAEAKRVDGEFARLERQIEASERRHEECEQRCERLQVEFEKRYTELLGKFRQMEQRHVSAENLVRDPSPPMIATLLDQIDRIPIGDLKQ